MIQSAELNELATALCAAQAQFDAVDKSAANPFFKSSYAPLPDVVKAATPILAEHGLSVSQLIGRDEDGDTLTAMLLHKSGQYIGSTMQLRPVKQDPQAQGSAVTYARRYSYMAILGLVAEEDDDGNAATHPRPSQPAPKKTPARKPAVKSVEQVKAEIQGSAIDGDVLKSISEAAKKLWPAKAEMRDKLKWELVAVGVEFSPEDDLPKVMESLTLQQGINLLAALEAKAGEA